MRNLKNGGKMQNGNTEKSSTKTNPKSEIENKSLSKDGTRTRTDTKESLEREFYPDPFDRDMPYHWDRKTDEPLDEPMSDDFRPGAV